MKTMILAAGRGNRLRPLTDTTPKPLLKVQGKPLIVHHIERLVAAGLTDIVINHAWLGEQIEEALGNGEQWGANIAYSPEPPGGYETAGGIIHALPKLVDEQCQQFMVVNGDVWTDYPYEQLATVSLKSPGHSDHLGHLILVPKPKQAEKGDFGLEKDDGVQKEGSPDFYVTPVGEWTFSGLSVLHADLFRHLSTEFLKLAPILRNAMAHRQITGEVYYGTWEDVGTPERLQALNYNDITTFEKL